MQRVVEVSVAPERGDGNHAVIRLAVASQPLVPDVRGRGAVLAVPGVVDRQHPTGMRSGPRVGAQQLEAPVVDLLVVPPGLGEEELQSLHRRVLRPDHRFRPGQSRQCLVPIPRREQAGQVLTEPASLGEGPENVVEPGRVALQRPRRRRGRHSLRHPTPHR